MARSLNYDLASFAVSPDIKTPSGKPEHITVEAQTIEIFSKYAYLAPDQLSIISIRPTPFARKRWRPKNHATNPTSTTCIDEKTNYTKNSSGGNVIRSGFNFEGF